MYERHASILFAAASLVVALIFGVFRVAAAPAQPGASPETPTLPAFSQPEMLRTEQVVQTEPPIHPDSEACALAAGSIPAAHVFVWDCATGQMIFCTTSESDGLYPASITKLYTAYLALTVLPPETVITAGEELSLVRPGSSTAYIRQGHRLTAQMLVEAMLLPSGNDAAYVLAAAAGREFAGDPELDGIRAVDAFVAEMNREAESLGLRNSHFVNPDGYHTEAHISCPADLAVLGSMAMEDPVIAKFAALSADTVTFVSGEHITWYNSNHLINPESSRFSPFALGGKTGYTREAGYCLLSVFEKDDRRILIGIFGAQSKQARYDGVEVLLTALRI